MASKTQFLKDLRTFVKERGFTFTEQPYENEEPDRDSFLVLFTTGPKKVGRSEARERYEKTYSYGSLMKEHSLCDYGVWEIYGEDPNCDLGGSHIEPLLGTVEATLDDAINYGVKLSGFWQWGGGGRFKKVTAKKIKKL